MHESAARRYAHLIESMLAQGSSAFRPQAESDTAIQVERGLVLPLAISRAERREIDRAVDRLMQLGSGEARIVDAAGQPRPAHLGLLVHAWRRALEVLRQREEDVPALHDWCARLQTMQSTDTGGDAWAALAMRAPPPIPGGPQPSGALLPDDPTEHPEAHWYRELVLLQAVATHGYIRRDAPSLAAANRAAMYHLKETQPDHATAEPWGLLAFIHNPDTHTLADQMLHTVQVQQPGGPRGVTRILLADTLLCLRNPPPA